MLRAGAALAATVCLCVVCAVGRKPRCSQDVFVRLNSLLGRDAPELERLDSRLYTPGVTDTQNCPVSSLMCLAAELKVLYEEWEEVGNGAPHRGHTVDGMIWSLARRLKKNGLQESDCQQCELLQEEDPETFLGALLSTLQYVQSRFCS